MIQFIKAIQQYTEVTGFERDLEVVVVDFEASLLESLK